MSSKEFERLDPGRLICEWQNSSDLDAFKMFRSWRRLVLRWSQTSKFVSHHNTRVSSIRPFIKIEQNFIQCPSDWCVGDKLVE
jgi:hypothetical protein